jgi:Tfp pilus assembly protein PilF
VRFGEDAFWVDSAIDLCKRAVSIDPTQARAYVVLARAYRCKNLFDQAAETITKALRLAPNDAEVNFRAGSQRLGSSADSEAYSMLRKAYSLDPNDPRKSYLLGLICAVIGEDELREKCMQRTIQLESDADRKKMLECELLTQRREYLKAFNELKDLPPDAVAYGPSALDLRVACAERASDWSFAIRATEAKATTEKEILGAWCFWKTVQRCSRTILPETTSGCTSSANDLKETSPSEYYCFEVNTSPAFLFYESPARPVVADALAEFLAQREA